MAKLRLASTLQYDSIVDGPGIRMVLWTQGCTHQCPHCHNPQTHDLTAGISVETNDIIQQIQEAKLQSGLTLSGGEPFLQSEALIPIVRAAKACGLNIWIYSGFTYEELSCDHSKSQLLQLADVLVDGRYVEALKDYRLKFRGSRNQRIIDIPKSLQKHGIILSAYHEENANIV